MVAILVTLAAVALLAFDLRRAGEPIQRPLWEVILRSIPFVFAGALSIFVASQAKKGRHPFSIDFSLAPADLARSLTKVAHFRSIAILFLLAVIAFGVNHLFRAFVATMLIGVGWELAEATLVGHYARLADLAPNLVAGVAMLLIVAALRLAAARRRPVTAG